ncbi:MAG: B12-binding domain-containing radical SAM protein [Gemmatimonadetes bacterium]|nr:B12-binding domain-containing radical SAM protein [Gemmatimonadota bacterium]NNM07512.1 B12-binding domain-containing radical SAM protein [Gemmatimonadota bacterium]
MRIDIVVVYVQRYQRGHEKNFVPPLTGIHLAALTPPEHSVRVLHQQIEPPDLDTDADLVALSFFSGFAREAYELAERYRSRGKIVVGGGPHVTFSKEEALGHFDAVLVGEAESAWADLIRDADQGNLQRVYVGTTLPLDSVPTPRYDLLPRGFFVPRVVQATRGCPFTCSFCTVPVLNPGFRTRPVERVMADVAYDEFKHWWQRKIVWFWDDNLTIDRRYARELLSRLVPFRKWWLTQASMDISKDPSLLDLMKRSGCIGVFFGIESFGVESLKDAHKQQNKAERYKERIAALHARGICVMAGFISGFDGDSPASIKAMAHELYEAGVDVPFLSILTPFPGTAAYQKLGDEGRLLRERGWDYYNGYNVTFEPKQMSPAELLKAHRELWNEAFSLKYTFLRIVRSARYLRWGAFLMCALMNSFYCFKRFRGNEPRALAEPMGVGHPLAHPAPPVCQPNVVTTPAAVRG